MHKMPNLPFSWFQCLFSLVKVQNGKVLGKFWYGLFYFFPCFLGKQVLKTLGNKWAPLVEHHHSSRNYIMREKVIDQVFAESALDVYLHVCFDIVMLWFSLYLIFVLKKVDTTSFGFFQFSYSVTQAIVIYLFWLRSLKPLMYSGRKVMHRQKKFFRSKNL